MRVVKVFVGFLVVLGVAAAGVPQSFAGSPYTVSIHISAHKELEFDPAWHIESPCYDAVGDLSEIFNGEAHVLAAGIDAQGNFVAPLHVEKTVEESILFVPYDPSIATLSGHSTVHVRNFEDSANAGFTNTVVLTGSDGSHFVFHEDVHILVTPSGIEFFVDHQQVHCT